MVEDISEWKMFETFKKITRTKIKDLKEHLENIHQLLNLSLDDEPNETIQNFQFTKREHEIIGLVGLGLANKEIAFRLRLSEATIKKNIFNIFKKTKTQNRLSLITFLKNHSYL